MRKNYIQDVMPDRFNLRNDGYGINLLIVVEPFDREDGIRLYRAKGSGKAGDEFVEWEEYWFRSFEEIVESYERREVAFFWNLNNPAYLEQMDRDAWDALLGSDGIILS